MTKIARYLFGVEEAQTISTRNIHGQYWYAAVDVCKVLGITNHSQAVHRKREMDQLTLTSSEWKKKTIYNGKSRRQMLFVNDNGMLKLVMQGTSISARRVQERAIQTPPNLIPALWERDLVSRG